MEGQNQCQVAVIMVPLPAQGHLNQLLHLSHLIASYDIPVYYAGSTTHNRQAKLRIHGWDAESLTKIHFHDFQLPSYTTPPPHPDPGMGFPVHLQPLFEATVHLREPVFELSRQLSTKFRRVIVIHDSLMISVVQDVKSIQNAESFDFIPISAFTRFFYTWEMLPEKPFQLESKVLPRCLPSTEGTITPEIQEFLLSQNKFWDLESSGKLFNTSRVIEGDYVELLEKLSANNNVETKHFVLGPFNPVETKSKSGNCKRHVCLKWLDEQEKCSVIYVSFGSMTSLTNEQITELAVGLERSGQKFIWVLRNADTGDVFAEGEMRRPDLPEGYEDRVKDRGMVIRDWAPQLEILGHPSTGGFMSHCGWNSSLESISLGVPIAAWPMHSDQPRNAVLITEMLKIGVMVRDWDYRAQLVTWATIESAVNKLMASPEGEEIRKRAAELGDAVRQSVSKGGVSSSERDAFIAHITRQ